MEQEEEEENCCPNTQTLKTQQQKKTVFFKMGNKPEQAPHQRYTDINYAQKMC